MVMDRDIDASMIIIIIVINTNNHYQDHNQLNFARKAIYMWILPFIQVKWNGKFDIQQPTVTKKNEKNVMK